MKQPNLGIAALAAAVLAGLSTTAWSQDKGAIGRADDLDRDESPVIVDDWPEDDEAEQAGPLLRAGEAFVKIRGAWASDAAACAGVDANGDSGLYLTDTLIRWEEASCSIRDIDSTSEAATVYAFCATGTGRSERTFELQVEDEDTLVLTILEGSGAQPVSLQRCPTAQ